MVSSSAAAPLHRATDLAVAFAILLFLAPLLVLTFALLLIVRDGSGRCRGSLAATVESFIYRSGLSDLPLLFDVVAGRASLFAGPFSRRQPAIEVPALNGAAPSAPPAARRETSGHWSGSNLEMLGRNLRDSFVAIASADFDKLLMAIDRATMRSPSPSASSTGRLNCRDRRAAASAAETGC
jgi:hypothetical protein